MKNISLFDKIKDDGIENILENLQGEPKVYPKGDLIWQQGDNISKIGIVLVGLLKIYTQNPDGSETLLGQVKDGEVFGVNYICSGLRISPVIIQAQKQTGVLFISYEKMLKECSGYQDWQIKLLRNMFMSVSKENLLLSERLEILDKKSIREKVMTYLNQRALKAGSSKFEVDLNREKMAQYLCVDRSALSRELSNLRNAGIIEFQKNEFTLL